MLAKVMVVHWYMQLFWQVISLEETFRPPSRISTVHLCLLVSGAVWVEHMSMTPGVLVLALPLRIASQPQNRALKFEFELGNTLPNPLDRNLGSGYPQISLKHYNWIWLGLHIGQPVDCLVIIQLTTCFVIKRSEKHLLALITFFTGQSWSNNPVVVIFGGVCGANQWRRLQNEVPLVLDISFCS